MNRQLPFFSLEWKPLIIVPLVLFSGFIALCAAFDIDKQLAQYLASKPGGFPYAGSETYEFWFHRFPKIISGTLVIAMIVVGILGIPFIAMLEKIHHPQWQKLLGYFTKTTSIQTIRHQLNKIPKAVTITLWLTIIAMVFSSEMIGHLKRSSSVYCPITIQAYGGSEDVPLTSVHEPFPSFGPNGGQCWPGGHSITGFIFEACFFALYALGMRRAAWISLAAALLYGHFLGFTQVLRGQHYISHQFWSSILCWYFSMMVFWCAEKYRAFKTTKQNSVGLVGEPAE